MRGLASSKSTRVGLAPDKCAARPPPRVGVGQTSPLKIFSSWVLPAPFSPSSAQRSPGLSCQVMSRNTHLTPRRTLKARSATASRALHGWRRQIPFSSLTRPSCANLIKCACSVNRAH